jgi:hypothetical protein
VQPRDTTGLKGVEKAKLSPAPKHPKPFSPPPATASQLAVGTKPNPAPQVKSTLKIKIFNFDPSWIVCERPCIFCGLKKNNLMLLISNLLSFGE